MDILKNTVSEAILAGGGEMGRLIRDRDWSQTPLGSVENWPQSLRTAVSILLNTRHPMVIFWGEELVQFYNDGYRPSLGVHKHPQALGQRGQDCWAEIWHIIGPQIHGVMNYGQETWFENQLVPFDRNGYFEEIYFTYSYSPIRDESGGVGGTLVVCTETTKQVIGERRLRSLRELSGAIQAQTVESACSATCNILLNNNADIPFALLYLIDGNMARLAATVNIETDTQISPQLLDLAEPRSEIARLLSRVSNTGESTIIDNLITRFGELPGGAWPESPHTAVILPITQSGHNKQLAGLMVIGVSARRAFDDDYRGFFELVASSVATAIANARTYEEERKRAEELAELDRAKTLFFSNVSHEFRTPLTLLLGSLEQTLTNTLLAPDDREQLQVAHRNGLRLLKLVNTLLDFSRIEAGRIQAVYEPTDLAIFTAELASVFRSAVERAGISFVVDCPPLSALIYVDREMWEKIVLNLLSNAFKFTFEGTISVILRSRENRVELAVQDTGIGISAEEIPHLFKRFHRVQGAQGRNIEGSGIGLSLVQELVKLHGGTVTVTSVLGSGSCFTVSIPTGCAHLPQDRINATRTLASTASASTLYLEEVLRSEGSGTWGVGRGEEKTSDSAYILLVEDNADMRNYVKRLLSQRYEVEAVSDGVAALAAIDQRLPDLVLTDVMMPLLDGFELLRRLRRDEKTRELPIILLSARAGEEAKVEGLEAGADDYLIKPFSARELLARVEGCLKMAQLRQEVARREQSLRLQAETANRIKDEFLAVLSHELRTPLNPILGWTKILRSHRVSQKETDRALEIIERNAKLQTQLIEDLLDVSRILRGKLCLNIDEVNLASTIKAAVETVQLAAVAKGIEIKTILSPTIPKVLGDANRLQQVVWNLLSNAVKFTPNGGRVEVGLSIETGSKYALITVSDTGKGINPDFLPYVFESFRQADSSTTRKFGGLGLGLAIVRSLVEMHGGTVDVSSLGEGQGATFSVRLPLVSSEPDAHQIDSESNSLFDLSGLRILVVDDETDSRELITFILEQSGAKVTSAASAREALTLLSQMNLDLLVTDIGMPDINGYMLIQQVRSLPAQQGGQIPAIALTAYAGDFNQQQAIAAGFQKHISKPIDPSEVVAVVASMGISKKGSGEWGVGSGEKPFS